MNINSFGKIGIPAARTFTVNLENDFPNPATLHDVADCLSLCKAAESGGDICADNSRDDEDARIGHVLQKVEAPMLRGLTPDISRTVVVAAKLDNGQPVRTAFQSNSGDVQSDRIFKDGKVQSIFEKRVLESGKAEILTLHRNSNGTITVACELTDDEGTTTST